MNAWSDMNAIGLTWNTRLIFALVFVGLLAVIAAVAASMRNRTQGRWWLLAGLAGGLAVAGVLLEGVWRVLALDAAALAAVGLVWLAGTPQARRAARTYFWMLLVAVVCIGAYQALGGEDGARPAAPLDTILLILVLVGFGIKLALLPFSAWLLRVAESVPALTTVLIVALVDMAAFCELIHIRQQSGWVFTAILPVWVFLGVLAMLGGALLALAQRDLQRMLVYSTIDDLGYLLLGLALGTASGLSGAVLGALSHAVMKVLLFGALAVAEDRLGHRVTLDDAGLAGRLPVCAAAFIVGALGMIGVPPTLGFVGRWRLYLGGSQAGGGALLAVMLLATGAALLYYVRAIHRVWLGEGHGGGVDEPRPARLALALLCALAIVAGVLPGLWTQWLY